MAIFKIMVYGIILMSVITSNIDKALIGLILLFWILSELIFIGDEIKRIIK